MKKSVKKWLVPALIIVILLAYLHSQRSPYQSPQVSIADIPEFSGKPYVVLNGNVPQFTSDELTVESFEEYSPLDRLGRCGVATACIGRDLMPLEERGSIGQVRPSGWQTVKYDIVDGKYLYNRCHLIGFQLTGENANTGNLITGTRYLNVEGMLGFENMVADYVKETGNHVMYRVTPCFYNEELVARGVTIEAVSVEDDGRGICFYIYAYNNQPGIENDQSATQIDVYILNTNTKKIHDSDCALAQDIKPENKTEFSGSRQTLLDQGYSPCGSCKP